jgi:Rieske Fe-S protein
MEKTIYGTAYVIKSGEQIRVLSNICTHLGCGVRWDQDQNAFLCPCHNGKFDIQGRPIAGPPPRPLTEYECRVVDGKLEIKMESA